MVNPIMGTVHNVQAAVVIQCHWPLAAIVRWREMPSSSTGQYAALLKEIPTTYPYINH